MAYTDGKAAGRRTTPAGKSAAPAPSSASNQEKTQGQSAKFRNYSFAAKAGVSVGNQVRVSGNSKGTGVAGRPSSQAEGGKDKNLAAVENPSGSRNQPGKF